MPEFVVVGGGLLGLAAARALSQRGRDVTVIEQFSIGHDRAGSKGSARIFRMGYSDPLYVGMALAAHRLWRALEDEAGATLLTTTGQVTFGADLDSLAEAMSSAGAPCEVVSAAEVAARYPALSVDGPAVIEPASGVLAADRCLAALRLVGRATIVEGRRVTSIVDDGRRVQVAAGDEVYEATAVVVCAGPWSSRLAPRRGIADTLVASMEQIAYVSRPPGVPVFMERSGESFYGLPVGPTLKIGFHGAGPVVDPDAVALADDPVVLGRLQAALGRVVPAAATDVVATEQCFYDRSPDEDFVVDRYGRVVIAAGTSGHGFKFGPLFGEMLADLAEGPGPGHARFALDRVPALSSRRASL